MEQNQHDTLNMLWPLTISSKSFKVLNFSFREKMKYSFQQIHKNYFHPFNVLWWVHVFQHLFVFSFLQNRTFKFLKWFIFENLIFHKMYGYSINLKLHLIYKSKYFCTNNLVIIIGVIKSELSCAYYSKKCPAVQMKLAFILYR